MHDCPKTLSFPCPRHATIVGEPSIHDTEHTRGNITPGKNYPTCTHRGI